MTFKSFLAGILVMVAAVALLPLALGFDVLMWCWEKLRPKWLWADKDGGADSTVTVWGLELKGLFSVLVMKFGEGSREAFHSHAFNSVSWLLSGGLYESLGLSGRQYWSGWRPIVTKRDTFHRVFGVDPANWVISLRGPWASTWRDVSAAGDLTLTHGRKVVQ